jgi:hypothetical protein
METLPAELFDHLREQFQTKGAAAAVDDLCGRLRLAEDYHSLFYALLMKKRVELGVTPFPMGHSRELPPETHEPYEDAIRESARQIGSLYLARNDFARAWGFYRLIGEPGPVKEALETYQPQPEDDTYAVVDIAWHQQVHPKKGFDIYLERHGICSTITMVSSSDLRQQAELRNYCTVGLVRTLYEQLHDRLRADCESRGLPVGGSVRELLHPELFAEDVYHIDVSHLSSVVQMSLQLPLAEHTSLMKASELAEYGKRLAIQFRGDAEAPFEETYTDYSVYLDTMLGREVTAGLSHFESKISRELEEGNTLPAEVYVNLLLKLDRKTDALKAAQKYLANLTDDRGLSCPSVSDLARETNDFASLAEIARAKGDAVLFLASVISSNRLNTI